MHPIADPTTEEILVSHFLTSPVLLSNQDISEALFTVSLNSKVLQACRELDSKGEVVSGGAVAQWTDDSNVAKHAKKLGQRRLGDLSTDVVLDSLKTMHRRRVLTEVGNRLIASSQESEDPFACGIEAADALLKSNESASTLSDSRNNDDIQQWLKGRTEANGRIYGLPTCLYKFDRMTNGMHVGNQVIAARPGGGKTSLGGCIALNAALEQAMLPEDEQCWVYFGSYEMPAVQIKVRMVANLAGIPLMDGVRTKHDQQAIMSGMMKFQKLKIIIDDKPSPDMDYVESRVRGLCKDKRICLCIFDYLQKMKPSKRKVGSKASETERIAAVSNHITELAKTLKKPFLSLAQLRRAIPVYDKKTATFVTPRPTMNDLKGSGAIEEDAEWIGLLHQLNTLIIDKNRHGPPDGEVKLRFAGATYKFEEADD